MIIIKNLLPQIIEVIKRDDKLAEIYSSADYFIADFHFAESELHYIDEVKIRYGGSEGIYADFYGFLSECEDRFHVFTLKTLDDSPAAFRQLCELSGAIVEIVSDLLKKEREVKG